MNNQNRLLELDCLRGIAAIAVVYFHITMGRKESLMGFNVGVTGVDLFFMISGFVIFLTIERTKTARDFLFSRFSRLYPTYWVCVTITALLTIIWKVVVKLPVTFPTVQDYLVNLSMVQYYFGVKDIDGPYWTLVIELFFYLIMLLIFISNQIKNIEIISLAVMLLALVNTTIFKSVALPFSQFTIHYIPFLNYCPLFFAGIIFYKIKFDKRTFFRVLILIFCLLVQIMIYNQREPFHIAIGKFEYGIAVSFYFLLFSLYTRNYLSFIVNKTTLFLGRISYSLYLIHQYLAVNLLNPLLTHSKYFHLNFWFVVICITMPIVLTLAYLLNRFVEIPSMLFLKRRMAKKTI